MDTELLAALSKHNIKLECECTRSGIVSIAECLETFGLRATVTEVIANTRCGSCGAQNIVAHEIIYSGQKGRIQKRYQRRS